MNIKEFKPGIYRHFKGNLYFAEKLIQDAENDDAEMRSVLYTALYPGHEMGFCRRLLDFEARVEDASGNPVRRFTLILALPVEKMKILLLGTMFKMLRPIWWISISK